jgi:hypothetical protein
MINKDIYLRVFLTIITVVIFFSFTSLVNICEKSFALEPASTSTNTITATTSVPYLSKNNILLKMYEIEKQVKLAIKNIPININYSIGHLQKASKLVDSDLKKELLSLEPRAFNQIQNQISDLKIIVNTTTIPMLVKGAQISDGLSRIVDLVQLLQVDKIENDTKISETLPSFFSSLNNDILKSYNNSNVWSNKQTVKQNNNNTKNINQINTTINISNYTKSLEYQTAQSFSAGALEFIDNLIHLKPDALKTYNTTKIKNDYNTLNQLINNKTHINEIEKFNNQNLSNVI